MPGTTTHHPCIVVGLGAAGSAALYHLARRGVAAVGFDAHTPPHMLGSSHGQTRMIREAYYEDPRYVSLVRRAYELWHALATESGTRLIDETGGVFAGRPWEEFISGIRRSAGEHGIPAKTLARDDQAARFPWLRPDGDMVVVAEPRAGYLQPERCISAHLDGAHAHGALIHDGEPVVAWRVDGSRIAVETPARRCTTDRLILCAGAWMGSVAGDIGVPLTVTRQTLFWFRPRGDAGAFAPDRFPVWAIEHTAGRLLYGFPDLGDGLKVAVHYGGTPTTADAVDRTVTADEVREITALVARYVPEAAGEVTKTAVCLYTNTPDLHFLVDAHPASERVLVVSACSGHGFKFASAVGEAAAEWAVDGAPRQDLSLFSRSRFGRDT
jgi:sarcosine oxidase